MRPTPNSEQASPPIDGAVVSARLRTFRRLCLVFALFTVGGVAATLGFLPATTAVHRNEAAATAIALIGLWLYGHYRGRFSLAWLPIEIATVVGFVHGIANPIAVLGVCYVGVQYRALYGQRREAALVAGAYILAFVLGLAFMPDGPGVFRPVVAVEIVAIGFCAYLLHTLSEALQRAGDRTSTLQRSEDNYRLLFENNPWPMWVIDPRTLRIVRVNAMAVTQYGYTRDEFLGMTLRELCPEEDLPALEQRRPQIESDSRFSILVRHRKRDGTVIEVEITSDSVDLGDGRVRIALAVDVTNRERSARALRESEQRFRAVAENLREALLITDTEDRIVLANARVHEVLGYTPEEVLGKNASELLLPESQRHVFKDRLRQRLSGASELYETEMVRKDGSRIHAEVSASPYRDASGRIIGTLGAISDISERKRLEERLRQGMRMEAVGQLAGGVAHDFNNLLTVIKLNTELLLADHPRGSAQRRGIVDIARSADRGASLTQQLLAFGRKQLLQPRRVTLAEIVADAAPMLRKLVGREVIVVTVHDNSTDQVFADPLQLEHVLVTLVRNANDAMPKGGSITIETRGLDLADDHPPVATQEMPTGRYTMLSVSDTGTGMTEDVQARLFEPFFTTKGPGEGTALGLASLYGVVRQSGGYVAVESAPNTGTTFRIYLPLAQAEVLPDLAIPRLRRA